MEHLFSMGGLIPLWIIGAPLVVGVLSLFSTPTPSRNDVRDPRVPQTSHVPVSPSGLSAAPRS